MLSEDNQLLYTLDPVTWVYTTTVNSLLQLSAFLSVTPEACFETYCILATNHFYIYTETDIYTYISYLLI